MDPLSDSEDLENLEKEEIGVSSLSPLPQLCKKSPVKKPKESDFEFRLPRFLQNQRG